MPRKKQKVDKSVLEHRKEAKRLLEHSKIKPLPKWSGPASILNISNMTPKQHNLYSAIIDHVRGKGNIKDFYPLIDEKHLEELKSHDPKLLKKLAKHTGSKASLVRFHRRVFSEAKKMDEKKGGGLGSTAAKVGKFLAEKGVALAKAAWSTTAKVAKNLAKIGAKAAKWVVQNPQKVAQLVNLVKSGIEIGKAISDMAGGPVNAADLSHIKIDQMQSVDKALQESTTDEDSTDWGEQTIEQAEEKKNES